MSELQAIAAIGSVTQSAASQATDAVLFDRAAPSQAAAPVTDDFKNLLMGGLSGAEQKIHDADALVRRFAIDDSVPIHQVTIALEEARIALELAVQVRSRLVESYRDIMNMQM
jgi:flagellar hook-basal body complex protein FliE